MTTLEEIIKDFRYRDFRKEQLRKLCVNEDKTMYVPEHIIWNMLLEHMENIKTDEDLDYVKDNLVDIANLCMLCYMSIEGFNGQTRQKR